MKETRHEVNPYAFVWWLVVVAILWIIVAGMAEGYCQSRKDPSWICPIPRQADGILTPGTEEPPSAVATATPEPLKFQVMKVRVDIPTGFQTDPAFWNMLTPEGQAVLSRVTVIASDEPRHYACPQVWEIGSPTPTPATCTYYGGMYEGDTNTISLWGEAAQANPDILRHEALHALDAAADRPASESGFLKAAGELAAQAEAMYNAGGGTWFRPNELWAMVPILVGWDFGRLPLAVAAYYAPWFLGAEGEEPCPTE